MNNNAIKAKIAVLSILVFLSSNGILLTSCTAEGKSQSVNTISQQSASGTYFTKANTIAASQTGDTPGPKASDSIIDSWDEYNSSRLPLISGIPEKNMYLYGIKPAGVILYVEDRGFYYDWVYMTPRFILPQMHLGDFDSDHKDELAVINYVGSGTGVSIEELHIVEISEEEYLSDVSKFDYSKPNPQYFKDYFYAPDTYISELENSVKLRTFKEAGELIGDISIGSKSYKVSLREYQTEEFGFINNNPCFGDIVDFNVQDKGITAQFALGITTSTVAAPIYVGNIFADVKYHKGKFTMDNFRFEGFEENS